MGGGSALCQLYSTPTCFVLWSSQCPHKVGITLQLQKLGPYKLRNTEKPCSKAHS